MPEEDRNSSDGDVVGELQYSMYGTRDAAQNWAEEYSECLVAAGFIRGVANPCLFRHNKKDICLTVHGDDFVAVGNDDDLELVKSILMERYKLKTEVLGPGPDDAREVRILNRVIRWTGGGIKLEADPRHAELIVKHFELEGGRVGKVPGSKPLKKKPEESDDEDGAEVKPEVLPPREASEHRSVVARLNYLTADRPDLQFATKELARSMSAPTENDVQNCKKVARYLLGRPRVSMNFPWQNEENELTVFSDSDWAGCTASRKSTSGGVLMVGKHLLKTYSRQQKTIALSSAEAELYALVAASAEALGLQAYAVDLGMSLTPRIMTDASAALGIAQRRGLGKVRHVQTQALWVQEVRLTGRLLQQSAWKL